MDIFVSFVGEYVGVIVPAILGIATLFFSGFKAGEITPKIVFMKVCVAVLVVAAIGIGYLGYRSGQKKDDDGYKPPETQAPYTQPTEGKIAVNAVLTEELPREEYDTIKASSTYTGDSVKHDAYNLIDGKPRTNWSEGVQENGEGEYVDFVFVSEQPVAGFLICAGNHSGDTYYANNARPKTITLLFADGSSETFALKDEKKEQRIYFDYVVQTDRVRMIIDSVYPGREWKDTVISEFGFYIQQ